MQGLNRKSLMNGVMVIPNRYRYAHTVINELFIDDSANSKYKRPDSVCT